LVRRGLAPSREAAQRAVFDGRVTVAGAPADKPARLVDAGEAVAVRAPTQEWVSRGGHKLDAALAHFNVAVAGRRCLDAGASTGGFTDVLLRRGAASVWSVDVGRGQLHDRLRHDPRVIAKDRTNVRLVTLDDLGGEPFDVVVADLSFISLRTVAPVLGHDLAATDADLVWLVKPQFEAGRRLVASGRGVIRDPGVWEETVRGVARALEEHGAAIMGAMPSPLRGADGNVEFLLWSRAHRAGGSSSAVDALISVAVDEVGGVADRPDAGPEARP